MPLPIITTLGDSAVAGMLERAQTSSVLARKGDIERRVLMLQDNWREYVWSYIGSIHKVDAVKRAISARVKGTYNVLSQICNRVCVAYNVPPIRQLEGAPQASQEAFAAVMRESKIVTKAKAWERYTFATNVIITVPRVRTQANGSKRLDYEMILADRADVYTDTADPMGDPRAVIYQIKHGSDYSADPLQIVVLDDKSWRYYNSAGKRIGTVEHGAGIFPGTVWRLDEPVDDWWCSTRGEGLGDAGVEVAYLAARMDWVRFSQDRYREYLGGEDINKIPTQVAGAEGPVTIPLPPASFSLQAIDVNTPIDNHQAHIRSYIRQAAESLGIPSIVVDFDLTGDGSNNADMNVAQHAALAKLRNGHLDYYRVSEHDSAWKTSLVLRGMGHPAASKLPPAMVLEHFAIEYPDLTFVDHPMKRAEVSRERIDLGLSSTIREYQGYYPHLTRAQARDEVLAIAVEEGELNQFYIQHNIPRGADARLKTLAQMQGAIGGEASGVARQPEDDNDDDAEQPGRASSSGTAG
jgi:hypothetical protein